MLELSSLRLRQKNKIVSRDTVDPIVLDEVFKSYWLPRNFQKFRPPPHTAKPLSQDRNMSDLP